MENTISNIESLLKKTEDYGKTSYELYRLKTVNKTAEVVSTFVSRGALVLVLSMFLIFASFGLALWLGEILGESYLGFLCVAAFYIVLGVVLFFFLHRSIKLKVSNSIISEILNN